MSQTSSTFNNCFGSVRTERKVPGGSQSQRSQKSSTPPPAIPRGGSTDGATALVRTNSKSRSISPQLRSKKSTSVGGGAPALRSLALNKAAKSQSKPGCPTEIQPNNTTVNTNVGVGLPVSQPTSPMATNNEKHSISPHATVSCEPPVAATKEEVQEGRDRSLIHEEGEVQQVKSVSPVQQRQPTPLQPTPRSGTKKKSSSPVGWVLEKVRRSLTGLASPAQTAGPDACGEVNQEEKDDGTDVPPASPSRPTSQPDDQPVTDATQPSTPNKNPSKALGGEEEPECPTPVPSQEKEEVAPIPTPSTATATGGGGGSISHKKSVSKKATSKGRKAASASAAPSSQRKSNSIQRAKRNRDADSEA